MADGPREPRTSITLPMSAVAVVDKLPDELPAFKAYRWPWRVKKNYDGTVNRSARIEAILAYAAAGVASPKTRSPARKAKAGA